MLFLVIVNINIESFIKYILVGGIAFIVDILIFYSLVTFVGLGYFVASIISFLIGVFANYKLARSYVFNCDKSINKGVEIIGVYIVSGVAVIIHQFVIYILVDSFKIDIYTSKVMSSIVVILWSYYARKKFIYKSEVR